MFCVSVTVKRSKDSQMMLEASIFGTLFGAQDRKCDGPRHTRQRPTVASLLTPQFGLFITSCCTTGELSHHGVQRQIEAVTDHRGMSQKNQEATETRPKPDSKHPTGLDSAACFLRVCRPPPCRPRGITVAICCGLWCVGRKIKRHRRQFFLAASKSSHVFHFVRVSIDSSKVTPDSAC